MKKQKKIKVWVGLFKIMGGNIPDSNFPGGILPGGSLIGGNIQCGSFPDTTCEMESIASCNLEL